MLSRLQEISPDETTSTVEKNEDATETTSRKRCAPCQKDRKKRYTQYRCKDCGQYLCLGEHCSFICADGCRRKKADSYLFFYFKKVLLELNW